MIIDGHAHSCGISYQTKNIIKVLDETHFNKVALYPSFILLHLTKMKIILGKNKQRLLNLSH